MVTDNKVIEDLEKRICYMEKKASYKENDDYTKLFSDYKLFISNRKLRKYFFGYITKEFKQESALEQLLDMIYDFYSYIEKDNREKGLLKAE